MSITLEQLSAKMRQGEQVPLQQTAQIVLTLSIPSSRRNRRISP